MQEVIAEIGQNHNGDMSVARQLIREAKRCGADVAKFQVYEAAALFERVNNQWYDYNCKTELSRPQVELLAKECEDVGIEFMASVFDVERISWLEAVGAKRYKIASRSILDQKLIEALCDTGKPLLVSLGHWNNPEFPIIETPAPVQFLYCVSKYPTKLEELKIGGVDFKKYSGFSDHSLGCSAAIAALTLGAQIIEKHLTLNKADFGPDHACSMSLEELEFISNFRSDLDRLL